jgi:hypothetical protein
MLTCSFCTWWIILYIWCASFISFNIILHHSPRLARLWNYGHASSYYGDAKENNRLYPKLYPTCNRVPVQVDYLELAQFTPWNYMNRNYLVVAPATKLIPSMNYYRTNPALHGHNLQQKSHRCHLAICDFITSLSWNICQSKTLIHSTTSSFQILPL